jgi:hypothetical protein
LADETGAWSGGRFQLVEADGYLNGSTIYKALHRLEESGMISLKSNTRFTEIRICKFLDYKRRGNTSGNNEVTTNEQQSNTSSNTLNRIKNKEYRNTMSVQKKAKDTEFDSVYSELNHYWSERIGRKLSDTKAARDSLKLILKNHTTEEVQYAISGAAYFQGKPYKPQVLSFASLHKKWDDLLGHMDSVKKQGVTNESNRFE